MESEEYRKSILRKVLRVMKKKLLFGEMKADRAKEIAGMLSSRFKPNISIDEVCNAVSDLNEKASELSCVFLPIIEEREKVASELKLNKFKSKLKGL